MPWQYNTPILVDAQTNIAAMRGRLALLEKGTVPPDATKRAAIVAEIRTLLDEAEKAATAQKKPWWPWWPRDPASSRGKLSWLQRRWYYTHVVAAFQTYHGARALAIELYSDRDVGMELPVAIAEARARLEKNDPRRAWLDQLANEKTPKAQRAGLQELVTENYKAADDAHRRLQRFRNVVILLTVGVIALMVCTTYFFVRNPDWVPLCFDGDEPVPEGTTVEVQSDAATDSGTPADEVEPSTVESAVQTKVCPTDEGVELEPKSEDVVAVVLMGLLGGSFAAVVAVRNLGSTTSPFHVPIALAVLKAPTGALTAVAGLIAIRGNFVPGLSDLDSPEQILAYALVLGYAQQLATGFLDRRAKEIAEQT